MYSLSMRKKAQIDKQMFFDFYGVSLLSDQYLEASPYAKQYKDTVVQQTKDVYVPLITKMVYDEISYNPEQVIGGWRKLKKELGINWSDYRSGYKNPEKLTLEQVAIIYNEGKWAPEFGGPAWGHITESLIQLKNATDTNQLITIIDHINDIQHNTGLMFHDFPKVEKWYDRALDVKAQATPEGLIPYLSTDLQKLVIEDLQLKGEEVIVPERYLSVFERIEQAYNTSTPPEVLAELAKDESVDVRNGATVHGYVASNPSTPSETLTELAKDKNWTIREIVARNPSTPLEVLAELAKDENDGVRWHVAQNPNTPIEIKEQLKQTAYPLTFGLNMKKKAYIVYDDKGRKFEVI